MTRDRDFKDLVRARMAATGEPYTEARQALVDARMPGNSNATAPHPAAAAHPASPYAVDSPPAPGVDEAAEGIETAVGVGVADRGEGAERTARKLYDKTVRTFFDGPRLRAIPSKRRPRVAVLLHRPHDSDGIPRVELSAKGNRLQLVLERDWIESRPLLRADLLAEKEGMPGLGIAFQPMVL